MWKQAPLIIICLCLSEYSIKNLQFCSDFIVECSAVAVWDIIYDCFLASSIELLSSWGVYIFYIGNWLTRKIDILVQSGYYWRYLMNCMKSVHFHIGLINPMVWWLIIVILQYPMFLLKLIWRNLMWDPSCTITPTRIM